MAQIIIIRRNGNFMKALPNIYDHVRDWLRQNSPEPRYLEHAKKFTLEIKNVGEEVPAVVDLSKTKTISFEEYREKNAPGEEIYS